MYTQTIIQILKLVIGTGMLYVVYILLLKKNAGGNLSRYFLLGGTFFFSLLPFLPGAKSEAAYWVMLPEIGTEGNPAATGAATGGFPAWPALLYWIPVCIGLLVFSMKIYRLYRLGSQGVTVRAGTYRITETEAVRFPFSFGRRIFLPKDMDGTTRRLVLEHETVHIRHRHTLDVLAFEALKIFGWFNPFYFLLEKELRQAHEFTADETVLRNGTSAGRYCEALLSCALAGMAVPVNYFNGSQIKTRIYMMNKPKNRQKAMALFAAALLMTGGIAFTTPNLFGQSEKQSEAFTAVDQMPEFPGGNEAMAGYLSRIIVYPEVAKRNKTEGRVFIEFVVDHTGKVKDASVKKGLTKELDAEALRAVQGMPAWTPGRQNGKAVSVKMVLPISFKLS